MKPIETLEDWNARLACCCGMPSCPEPTLVGQVLHGVMLAVGFSHGSNLRSKRRKEEWIYTARASSDDWTRTGDGFREKEGYYEGLEDSWYHVYIPSGVGCGDAVPIPILGGQTDIHSGNGSGVSTRRWSNGNLRNQDTTSWVREDPEDPSNPNFVNTQNTKTYDTSGNLTGENTLVTTSTSIGSVGWGDVTYTQTYSNTIDVATWDAGAFTALQAVALPTSDACWGFTSSPGMSTVYKLALWSLDFSAARFKFQVPNDFTGTYYKVVYDLIDIPDDGVFFPVISVAAASVEYERLPDQTWQDVVDAAAWIYLSLPGMLANRYVGNLRVTCWRESRYGGPKPRKFWYHHHPDNWIDPNE